jgi:putative transposase
MGIPRSTFYDQPKKVVDHTAIVEAMFAVCDDFEAYGYRRVGAALRQQGLVVNHKKLLRLMREHDLQPKVRRRFVATPTAITMVQSSPTWRRTSFPAVPTSSGCPTSPISPCRLVSFTWRSSWTSGLA